jgi:hypothetical protein
LGNISPHIGYAHRKIQRGNNALLVGNFLRLYGPVRGWWMFPFERVIGNLQRSRTNNKLGKQRSFFPIARLLPEKKGQMEKRMFNAFSVKSTIYVITHRLSGLDGWKTSIAITEQSFGTEKRGTYMAEMHISGQPDEDGTFKRPNAGTSSLRPLDEAIRVAMEKSERDLQRELGNFRCPEEAQFQDRVTIRDHEFATYRTSEKNGVIFFQHEAGATALVPGMVRAIFLVTQGSAEHVFLAVHRYLAPPASLPDPFACYPDFGASLWSSNTQKEITIVPGNRDIYHAIYREWEYKIMVMKPLNRVSKHHTNQKMGLTIVCSAELLTFPSQHAFESVVQPATSRLGSDFHILMYLVILDVFPDYMSHTRNYTEKIDK